MHKIHYYEIRGNLHNWISDCLRDRTQQVVPENGKSKTAPVQSGVPQSSVLGPILFLLYINDLPDNINHNLSARLFAEDCVV